MHEADCSIIGGHSVADEEIKFGYAVTGAIHPTRIKANAGARPGDALVFTKRIGTGVIATALKRGMRVQLVPLLTFAATDRAPVRIFRPPIMRQANKSLRWFAFLVLMIAPSVISAQHRFFTIEGGASGTQLHIATCLFRQ